MQQPSPYPCPPEAFNAYVEAYLQRHGGSVAQLWERMHLNDSKARSWRAGHSPIPWTVAELVRQWALGTPRNPLADELIWQADKLHELAEAGRKLGHTGIVAACEIAEHSARSAIAKHVPRTGA